MHKTLIKGCLIIFLATLAHIPSSFTQGGFHFGVKAGPSLANQNWNEFERRMLFAFHGNVFVETRDENNRGALFAQLGMHTRGSSIRSGTIFGQSSIPSGYKFQNLSLMVGAKKQIETDMYARPYYLVGIRVEYTVANNLQRVIETVCTPAYLALPGNNNNCRLPDPIFINSLNYGISIGGGFEFQGGEFFTPMLEFTISPDVSFQYDRPELQNFGVTQARVRNLTFEVSLVLRFLREVIYTDK